MKGHPDQFHRFPVVRLQLVHIIGIVQRHCAKSGVAPLGGQNNLHLRAVIKNAFIPVIFTVAQKTDLRKLHLRRYQLA